MRKGWQTKRLGEVCKVVNGGTPKTGVAAYWNGPHQWVTPAEMGKLSSPFIAKTKRSITAKGMQNSSAHLLPPLSVILSSRAPIGYLVINTVPMATNQGCKGLVPPTTLDHKFLFYFLSSIVDLLNELGTGATFKELSGGKLKTVLIPSPPLPEQKRIVGILDEAFAGIAAAKATAEQNLQNARALFESHLNAVFTQKGPGWVNTIIGESTRFIDYRGKTPKKTESGLRLITAKNVKMGFLQNTPEEFVSPNSYADWMTRGIPQRGDVLFTTEAPLANVAQLDTNEKVVFAQRIIIMQSDASALDSTFLKYLLLSQPVQHRIHAKGTGATVKGIKASLLKKIGISFPKSLAQQEAVVAKLDALSAETARLAALYEGKVSALEALKKSLLHQAFAGEL